jgi:excisionase family DNA binding protein
MTTVIPFTVARPAAAAGGAPQSVGRLVYSVKEVAAMLDLSLGATYGAIRLGEIPARKLGNRWVIPKHRFHAWLGTQPDSEAAA